MPKRQRPGVKPSNTPRAWAPKVRTGCQTCRARHVKCDEQQPSCRRCVIAGYTCSGLLSSQPKGLPRQAESPSDATLSSDSQEPQALALLSPVTQALPVCRQRKPPTRKGPDATLVAEIRPADWYYSEAVGYFNTCLLDKIRKFEAIPINYHIPVGKNVANHDAFIAFILAYRITQISQDRGSSMQPSDAYQTKHLWERLYTCISNQITIINHEVARMDSSFPARNRVLTRIQGIKCVELMLQSPIWRAHTEGFLSLLKFCGGVKFAQGQQAPTRRALNRNAKGIIMESVLSNSVGPPNNQIVGVSHFTTEELLFFYRENLHPSFPCPTELFRRIIETNTLRVKVYTNPSHENFAAAVTILQRIDAFQPNAWTESSYDLPDIPEVPLIASIYRLAVGLFSLMALQPAGLSSVDKVERRSSLIGLLEAAWKLAHCRDALNWPLAVVGCALAEGGTLAEQAFICECLEVTAKHVFAVHPLVIISSLKRFWASGMVQWDNCWGEPYPVIG